MADDIERDLYKAQGEAQNKFVYYLITASGAGIAFAITTTYNESASVVMLPLAAAVLFWGISIISGCYFVQYSINVIQANFDLVRVQAGKHPLSGTHPEKIKISVETIREIIEKKNNVANGWFKLEFRTFVAAAISFVVWHVWQLFSNG